VDRVERAELAAVLLGEHLRDGRGERGLPVVDVADRADVHVRLRALERFLRHGGEVVGRVERGFDGKRAESARSPAATGAPAREPPPGLEPGTPSLPWKCSTAELRRRRN